MSAFRGGLLVLIDVLAHRTEIRRRVQVAVVPQVLATRSSVCIRPLVGRDETWIRGAERPAPTVVAKGRSRLPRRDGTRKPVVHELLNTGILADAAASRSRNRSTHPGESARARDRTWQTYQAGSLPATAHWRVFLPVVPGEGSISAMGEAETSPAPVAVPPGTLQNITANQTRNRPAGAIASRCFVPSNANRQLPKICLPPAGKSRCAASR